MEEWVAWMIAAAALAVGEILSLSFFMGPVALAALLAAVAALVGAGLAGQLAVFVAGSAASLLLLRPIARRHLRTPAHVRTGTSALIGSRAVVLEQVDADRGQVKIGGEVWTARALEEDAVLEPGTRVEVIQIEGATAVVSE